MDVDTTIEKLLNILTYYHLQEFSTGSELIQALQEDDYARQFVAPAGGVEQLLAVFTEFWRGSEIFFL